MLSERPTIQDSCEWDHFENQQKILGMVWYVYVYMVIIKTWIRPDDKS